MKHWLPPICRLYSAAVIGATVFLFGVTIWRFLFYRMHADYGGLTYEHIFDIMATTIFSLLFIGGIIYLVCLLAKAELPLIFKYCAAIAVLDVLVLAVIFPPINWA